MCYFRSFAELSKVLEPGKQVKIDKTSIIADAIRAITQLRSESNQLRQLNKFLEVSPCLHLLLHEWAFMPEHGTCTRIRPESIAVCHLVANGR